MAPHTGRHRHRGPERPTTRAWGAHAHKRTVVLDATHWVNHEKKEELMQEMDRFFGELS